MKSFSFSSTTPKCVYFFLSSRRLSCLSHAASDVSFEFLSSYRTMNFSFPEFSRAQ